MQSDDYFGPVLCQFRKPEAHSSNPEPQMKQKCLVLEKKVNELYQKAYYRHHHPHLNSIKQNLAKVGIKGGCS